MADKLAAGEVHLAKIVTTELRGPIAVPCDNRQRLMVAHICEANVGFSQRNERRFRLDQARTGPGLARRGLCGVCPLARDQRHADRPDHAVMRRHDDPLLQDLRKGGGDGIVVGGAALEEDGVADLASPHHAVQVIERYRICQPGAKIADFGAFQHQRRYVAFHEHRAALAQPRRMFRSQRQRREFALDVDAQLLRLLFQERARSRRAGFVHGEVDDDALVQADELGILPADFEDRVHRIHAKLLADVGRRPSCGP